MSWSKLKQQLEGFLSPALHGRVEYRAPGYRYLPDKTSFIRWYQTELEIKNDLDIHIPISNDEIEAVRKAAKGTVPEDRLQVIARSRKSTEHAKELGLYH